MFNNSGKDLKRIAQFIFWLFMIPAVILAVLSFVIFINEGRLILSLLLCLVFLLLVYVVGKLSALRLYAFGELVERTTALERHFVGIVDGK